MTNLKNSRLLNSGIRSSIITFCTQTGCHITVGEISSKGSEVNTCACGSQQNISEKVRQFDQYRTGHLIWSKGFKPDFKTLSTPPDLFQKNLKNSIIVCC